MKSICIILIVLTFIATSIAQTKTFEDLNKENKTLKNGKCEISYDKFKDITTITSRLAETNMPWHTIKASFSFSGKNLSSPVTSYSVFFTTLSLLEDTSLIFIANDERVKIGEAIVKNQRVSVYGYRDDAYGHAYEFSPEQLGKFASAEKVEFQIGSIELTTKKDVSQKLRNLISLAELK